LGLLGTMGSKLGVPSVQRSLPIKKEKVKVTEGRETDASHALESFMLAMWDLAGEDGTKNFGLHLSHRAVRALMQTYDYRRTRINKDGNPVISTAMGDVILYEDR
jgi:hypothetical protein